MARTVSIGAQDFEELITKNNFYVDKTLFIKEWWESDDKVTLITRPRRFGKTLNMNMLERFFSVKFKDKGGIFENLNIWKEEKYRKLQGDWPVIFLSFAGIKETEYTLSVRRFCEILQGLYIKNYFLLNTDVLTEGEKKTFKKTADKMESADAAMALQEAYTGGYWEELVSFTRNLFNNTFKTNPYLERAVMTGITRISKESMFSDINNLNIVTITSDEYASCLSANMVWYLKEKRY